MGREDVGEARDGVQGEVVGAVVVDVHAAVGR